MYSIFQGILADEMGLGKTVEVLSCMLCNPREDIPKPIPLPVINICQETRKRRRRRSPSPTEFELYEHEDEVLDEKDGHFEPIEAKSVDKTDSGDDESDNEDMIAQVDGGDSDDEDFEESEQESETSEEEYIPRSKRSRKVHFDDEEVSDEDVPLASITKKAFAAKNKKQAAKPKKAKMKNTNIAPDFDPASILANKTINSKSKLEDMILYAIVKKHTGNNAAGVSVGVIKKYIIAMFDKKQSEKQNKLINNELAKLVRLGKILNTSGLKGASGTYDNFLFILLVDIHSMIFCLGSFVINPDFENFDSRSLYVDMELDPIDQFIEDLITERCYEGQNYVKIKTKTELQLEKAKKERKAKKESLYDKLLPMYELELGSEVIKPNRQKRWNGTFFDTKVERQDYFECICGSDLDHDEDRKYRVQCKECRADLFLLEIIGFLPNISSFQVLNTNTLNV